MKKLTTFVLLLAMLAIASCTKDKTGNNGKSDVTNIPFTGDWVASDDPIHLIVKSTTGKIEIPILGEVNDVKAAALIKSMIAQEFDFKGSYMYVTQIKSDKYNVRLEAMIGTENIITDAYYENGILTFEFNPEDIKTKGSHEELYVNVFQETTEDLRLYLDKAEVTRLLLSGIIQFGPQTKADFDIAAILEQIQELEFGINLKKDE